MAGCFKPRYLACKVYNHQVCGVRWALYFLVPMLFEHGLGKLFGWCDRLALDEPEVRLPSPT